MQRLEVTGGQRSFHRKVNGVNLNIKQTAMFTYDVKVMQGPERGVSLTVRLERQQPRAIFLGQVLQKWPTPLLDESFLAIGNWEINAMFLDRQTVPAYQRHRKNVEATTDCVNIRAGLDAKSNRQDLLFKCNDRIVRGRRRHVTDLYRDISLGPRF